MPALSTPYTVHGGSDSGPPVLHDFSSNANPYGPPPGLLQALRDTDRSRYPDPHYLALRQALGAMHGVDPERVLPCSGGAEAIRRLSLAARLHGVCEVWVPQPGFGDYAAAAHALDLPCRNFADADALIQALGEAASAAPVLVWLCEPCNPTGATLTPAQWHALSLALDASGAALCLDLAYEPLRLDGGSALPDRLADLAWRLHCPNKALGLTGVRAAYLLAPAQDQALLPLQRLQALAPSWVLAAEGQTLLMHWIAARDGAHLHESRERLRADWLALREALQARGWQWLVPADPSCPPFGLVRPDGTADLLPRLRRQGIKLRDAHSFGLPGWYRLSAQPAAARRALLQALDRLRPGQSPSP
ncbi:MAG: aminotransferase class I/II-fold pyridoxal phosphate-dependent enzyme [Burkholderiaceae bacterium]|nr:aminotransferase class I/II-fold pyridoxal phosphate-dependent enzyme [Burkholderiaceae bacterium]